MINVNSQNSNAQPLVKAKVIYEDVNDHDRLVDQRTIKGAANSKVDVNHYKQQIPYGYEFVGYGNFDQQLVNGHSNVIYIRKISSPSSYAVRRSVIKVDYVNNSDQLVGRRSFVGQSGAHFQLQDHKDSIPKGYRFNKILVGHNVNRFSADTQIIVVALNKVRVHSKIVVHYVYNGSQIGHMTARSLEGDRFDLTPFKKQIPAHYHFVRVDSSVPATFKSSDMNVDIRVAPDRPKVHHSSAAQSINSHIQNKQQGIKNDQDLGKVLSEIGVSLNSLGKIIRSQNHSNR